MELTETLSKVIYYGANEEEYDELWDSMTCDEKRAFSEYAEEENRKGEAEEAERIRKNRNRIGAIALLSLLGRDKGFGAVIPKGAMGEGRDKRVEERQD